MNAINIRSCVGAPSSESGSDLTARDQHGHALSGASRSAIQAYEAALAAFQSWRDGVELPLGRSLAEAPAFTMAHVLDAYRQLVTRDIRLVRQGAVVYERVKRLRANARERLHVAVIGAVVRDDFARAQQILDRLLSEYPRDVLAVQIGHGFDYLTGDLTRMERRTARALAAWTPRLAGYSTVLSMRAFSLVESGQYEAAEEVGHRALELDPWDARAHHAITHVYEMTGAADAGVRWMRSREDYWVRGTTVAPHLWWHLALFHLSARERKGAMAIYDRLRASPELPDLIDATSLLWRLEMVGASTGLRWRELANAWERRISDGYCTFSDVHAMLAFVGAHNWTLARRLESALVGRQSAETRYGVSTRKIGLPVCRAIMAFGCGDDRRAIQLLSAVSPSFGSIGGSHAQRDVLYVTLQFAMERMRRSNVRVLRRAALRSHQTVSASGVVARGGNSVATAPGRPGALSRRRRAHEAIGLRR